jgi:hypothetical protein
MLTRAQPKRQKIAKINNFFQPLSFTQRGTNIKLANDFFFNHFSLQVQSFENGSPIQFCNYRLIFNFKVE